MKTLLSAYSFLVDGSFCSFPPCLFARRWCFQQVFAQMTHCKFVRFLTEFSLFSIDTKFLLCYHIAVVGNDSNVPSAQIIRGCK